LTSLIYFDEYETPSMLLEVALHLWRMSLEDLGVVVRSTYLYIFEGSKNPNPYYAMMNSQ
jgi:hypothetical protein